MSTIDLSQPGALAALQAALNTKPKEKAMKTGPVPHTPASGRSSPLTKTQQDRVALLPQEYVAYRVTVCDRNGHVMDQDVATGASTRAADAEKNALFDRFRKANPDGQVYYDRLR